MVTTRLEDRILLLSIVGEFSADEFQAELTTWIETRSDDFVGYIINLNEMTKHPAMEQRKAVAYEKNQPLNKPHVIVGKDEKIARLLKIFERFTKADVVKYFTNDADAKAWILSQV